MHSIKDAQKFLKASGSCEFSWANVIIAPKNKYQKRLIQMYPNSWKMNNILQNGSTKIYCIYNGVVGRGINKKSGCIAGTFDIDLDKYGPLGNIGKSQIYGLKNQECNKEIVDYLLFSDSFIVPDVVRPDVNSKKILGAFDLTKHWLKFHNNMPLGTTVLFDKWNISSKIAKYNDNNLPKKVNAASEAEVLFLKYKKNVGGRNESLKNLKLAAEKGFPEAQWNYGEYFEYYAPWQKSNKATALKWYTKAAHGGFGLAQLELGKYYDFKVESSLIDKKKALHWYLKAAKNGITKSFRRIGRLYEDGRGGITKDLNKALHWYQKSADSGDPDGVAQLHLLKTITIPSQKREAEKLLKQKN